MGECQVLHLQAEELVVAQMALIRGTGQPLATTRKAIQTGGPTHRLILPWVRHSQEAGIVILEV